MDNKSKEEKRVRLPWLDVKVGDVVMHKETKRIGYVHEIGRTFKKTSFIVNWYDNPKEKTLFASRRTQQELVKTGENFNEDSDDETIH